MSEMETDKITERIIGCSFKVHTELGPGFLERIYHNALKLALKDEGLNFMTEQEFDVFYINRKIGAFKCDLLVENRIIVELKSVTGIMPILFRNQVISYLRASKTKTGLLINFGNKSCEVKRLSV